jgi:hypothetical protein
MESRWSPSLAEADHDAADVRRASVLDFSSEEYFFVWGEINSSFEEQARDAGVTRLPYADHFHEVSLVHSDGLGVCHFCFSLNASDGVHAAVRRTVRGRVRDGRARAGGMKGHRHLFRGVLRAGVGIVGRNPATRFMR